MTCPGRVNLNMVLDRQAAEARGEPTHFPCACGGAGQAIAGSPAPIYATGSAATETDDKAAQLRKLALIGIAATDTNMNLQNLEAAFQGLFEVMHRLAGEVEEEVEEMKSLARPTAA